MRNWKEPGAQAESGKDQSIQRRAIPRRRYSESRSLIALTASACCTASLTPFENVRAG